MQRVYSNMTQIPGVQTFICPHCSEWINIVSDKSENEISFACPKCNKPFIAVFAPKIDDDVNLHTELERAKPIGGNAGMRLFKCPYCGNTSLTAETGVLFGTEEEKQYLATCIGCGRDYVRDLRE